MNAQDPSSDELIGQTVAGRYRIISVLGAGGMGVAYRAWDEQGGVPVVIKLPKRIFLQDATFAERFSREIRLLQGLSHPSIVPIVDLGEHDGLPYVVMRFLPGGSLSHRRLRDAARKPMPMLPATLHSWLPKIAAALDHVHAKGIVHRDVKPANIFFDAFWGAFLGDFGIAKIIEESDTFDKEHTLTATHMGVGTQEYMSPEQFMPKAVIDGRADQYALAVTVYELLAGVRPFTGSTAHLIVEVTTQQIPPLNAKRRDIPASVVAAVHKGLAKNPADRFATCQEFAESVLRDVLPPKDEPEVARLMCPSCSKILRLSTEVAGKKGTCPTCNSEMMVAEDLGALWLLDEAKQRDHTGKAQGKINADDAGEPDSTESLVDFSTVSSTVRVGTQGGWLAFLRRPQVVLGVGGGLLLLWVVASNLLPGSRDKPDGRTATATKVSGTSNAGPRDNKAQGESSTEMIASVEDPVATNGRAIDTNNKGPSGTLSTEPPSGGQPPAPPPASDSVGLIGAVTMSGSSTPFVFTYTPGEVLPHATIEQLVSKGVKPKGVRVELKGTFSIPEGDELLIRHSGGSASGGVHFLFIDGKEVGSVGDDRPKNITHTLKLKKGQHTVVWLLTGGHFGNSALQFYNQAGDVIPIYPVADAAQAGLSVTHVGERPGKDDTFGNLPPAKAQPSQVGHGPQAKPVCHLSFDGDWKIVETSRGQREIKRVGSPINTDGVSGPGVRLGLGSHLEIDLTGVVPLGNSERTLSLWTRTHRLGQANLAAYLSYGGTNERNQAWAMCLGSGSNYHFNGNWHDVRTTVQPTLGKWDHIVTVKRGDEIELWVNGVLKGSVAGPTNTVGPQLLLGKNLVLGRQIEADLDELQIWDYPLRSDVIQEMYREGSQKQRLDGDSALSGGPQPFPQTLTNSIGIKLNLIPAGRFTMGEAGGNPDETPHEVTLTKPFYIGVHEVTNSQWKRVMGSVPSHLKEDDRPVEQVSWEDIQDFCRKLSALPEEQKAGRIYRLPAEAEWEYACRAGTTTRYTFGDDPSKLGEYGWFGGNSGNQTHPVGQKKPNNWGLHDMHGNVWEWCHDWYHEYDEVAVRDPRGPSVASFRVFRGGSWDVTALNCRSTIRFRLSPSRRGRSVGFRLALSPSGDNPPEPETKSEARPTQAEAPVVPPNSPQASLQTLTNSVAIQLTLIPAGKFTMGETGGNPSEPPHEVTLTKPFYMGVYEVTNAQWKQVMGSVPSKWKDDDRPVEQVNWEDAVQFCKKLSELPEERQAGWAYRLPTEAEWEYACRAGSNTKYSFGDDESQLGEYGWFYGNSGSMTHPVGKKKPNAWGLYDMHGNVWEWCSDWYSDDPSGAVTDPQGPSGASGRVSRGGCWANAARGCRSAFRQGGVPSSRGINLGFRLALSPPGVSSPEVARSVPALSNVVETLAAKREIEGLAGGVIPFMPPKGNGRNGGRGIALPAPNDWNSAGTRWTFGYVAKGSAQGFQLAHPHKKGHVVVTFTRRKKTVTVVPGGSWNDIGWDGGLGLNVTRENEFEEAITSHDWEIDAEVESVLAADGSYELRINGKKVLGADVQNAAPLQFTEGFERGDMPEQLPLGYALLIVGPIDGGENRILRARIGTCH